MKHVFELVLSFIAGSVLTYFNMKHINASIEKFETHAVVEEKKIEAEIEAKI